MPAKTKTGGKIDPELAKDMAEAYAFMSGKTKTLKRFTTETYRIADPRIAKAAREQLHLSQPRFAELVNSSPSTVRAWEQGTRRPDGIASVFLELIKENPDKMKALLEAHKQRLLKAKQNSRKRELAAA